MRSASNDHPLHFAQVLSTSKDLKTSACTASGRPHAKLLEIFKKIPTEVMEKFYGCGAPLPLGIAGATPVPVASTPHPLPCAPIAARQCSCM